MVCRHYLKFGVCSDNCPRPSTCVLFLQHDDASVDIDHLLNTLCTHEDQNMRNRAAIALGRSKNPKITGTLLTQLEIEENTEVKSHIVFALGMLREVNAITRIVTLLKEPEPIIREYAIIALGNIGERSVTEDIITILEKDPDSSIRGYAAIALGRLSGSKAMRALLRAMQDDPDPEVRKIAEKSAGIKKASIFQ